MKKAFTFLVLALLPLSQMHAALPLTQKIIEKSEIDEIPLKYLSSSKTSHMEWGCPVNDVVKANSRAEALGKIEGECREEVRRAANGKPDVLDVISTKTIWPDVQVKEISGGYELTGTFFLETVLLHRMEMGN